MIDKQIYKTKYKIYTPRSFSYKAVSEFKTCYKAVSAKVKKLAVRLSCFGDHFFIFYISTALNFERITLFFRRACSCVLVCVCVVCS